MEKRIVKISWLEPHVQRIEDGETIDFAYMGKDIKGLNRGQLCVFEPITSKTKIEVGDIIMGKDGLHLIRVVLQIDNERYLLGNGNGVFNSWIGRYNIIGKCIGVGKQWA